MSSPDHTPSSRTPLAFGLSALLHGLVAGLVLWSFWQVGRAMTPDSNSAHVFTMVDSPDAAAAPAAPGPASPDNSIATPNFGAALNIQQVNLPPEPAPVVPPPPQPATQRQPTTQRQPVTPPPAPARSTSARAPATRETVSYAEYQRQTGTRRPGRAPAPTTTRSGAAGGGAPDVGLNAEQFGRGFRNGVGTSRSGSGTSPTPGGTSNYEAMLKARLREAFESPAGLVLAGLAADIEVTIAPDGRVAVRRLVASSGNPSFDAAVRAAMARVVRVDPPPGEVQRTFFFTFQLVAE